MKTTARLATVGGFALAVATLISGPAFASEAAQPDNRAAAVFVETDNTTNTIVAYDRGKDGTLTEAGSYLTGGAGSALDGAVVDKTASQGSLTIDRTNRLLYAVNAGSDTITVFSVHGDRLAREQIIASGGDFPVSVTSYGNLVYVLNARDGGSVQGYLRHGARLTAVPAWHRDLGLDTSLTPEFTHTPGQIAFTPNGTKLIVTTKANGNNIDVFDVDIYGGLSRKAVVNPDADAVPFAVAFDQAGHLLVAEAGTNAVAVFSINRDATLTLVSRAETGQSATCWVTANGNRLYASNAGSSTLSGFSASRSGVLTPRGTTSTDAGTVDAAMTPDGAFLYVQTGAAGVVDAFSVNADGSLTARGSVTVPGAIGGEGIVTN